jgi:hypothetical protein
MTKERFEELMDNTDLKLTNAEWREGWHFCDEFDGLLRNNAEDNEGVEHPWSCQCRADGK